MANSKISALTSATTPLSGSEVLPIVQLGATVKVANNDLRPKQIQSNVTTGVLQIAGPAAAATRVMTVPDANFTAARIDAAQSFIGDQTLSTGNLIQGTAGKGINFTANSAAAGMTSQLLNWYEEGTWTATISDGTNNATMANSTCQYTRVGRQVTVGGLIATSSLGSVTGNIRITGLPFTIPNSNQYYSSATVGNASNLNITAGQSIGVYGEANSTFLRLMIWSGTGGTNAMTAAQWTATGSIILCFTYFTS